MTTSIQNDRRQMAVAFAALLGATLALASPARAAVPTIEARLGSPEIGVGETTELLVTVRGARDARPPQVPRARGVELVPAGTTRRVSIVNGAVDEQVSHRYLVQGQRVGQHRIGPIRVAGAQPVSVTVDVRAGRASAASSQARSGPPRGTTRSLDPPGRRAFLRVRVPEDELVVGQSVPVTIRAYVKAGTEGAITGLPELDNDAFAIHDLVDDARQGRTEIRGTPYATLTWRGRMTALLPGEHEVEASAPATLRWRELVQTRGPARRSLLDEMMDDPFFARAFGGQNPFAGVGGSGASFGASLGPPRTASVTLTDDLGVITVTEPPAEGRPEGWDGAIGTFEADAALTPRPARAGEPMTLTLTVRGEGSFDRLHHAMIPEDTEGMRVYTVQEDFTPDGDARHRGTKTFEQTLIPIEPGTLALPPLTLSTYDPEEGRYVTTTIDVPPIEVEPAEGGAVVAPNLREAAEAATPDGAPVPDAPGAFVDTLDATPSGPVTGLLALLVMLGALGAGLFLARRDPDASAARRDARADRRAMRRARRQMRRAARRGDAAAFFSAAERATRHHLAAHLDVRPEAATAAEAERHGVALPDALRAVLERADAIAFGGADAASDDLDDWLARVLPALDADLRSPNPSETR